MPAPPPYDPTGWSADDPSTWPPPIPPAVLYQPGMSWTITAPGVVDGQTVDVGDLLFAVHRPRRYGDDQYGSGMYGLTPAADWSVDVVAFLAWYASLPPESQPPQPYSGCPFGATGWWVIIESWFTDRGRRYGDGTYGSGVYGGADPESTGWHDITAGYVDVEITRGNEDGAAPVDAIKLSFTWYDPDWQHWDVAPPASYSRPFVGDAVRVSFYDPVWRWYPRAVGEIEQIVDAHGAPPRFVTVDAFGHVMDLDRTLLAWQRPTEPASTRFAALLTAAGWRYGTGALVYPPDAALHADREPRDVKARDEIDRTCLSAGWTFDTDLFGQPRLRAWPLQLVDPPVDVTDCADHGPPGAVATVVTYTADQSQLLNIVQATNSLDPPTISRAFDPVSIAVNGGRDNALGFPATDLAFYDQHDGDLLVDRIRDRYSRIVTHVDPIVADTLVDPAWLPILAGLDTGAHLAIHRVHPTLWDVDGIVVGMDETITPDRIEANLSTTTTTPTT